MSQPFKVNRSIRCATSLFAQGVSISNQEHVALPKQGVAVWNAWRSENPDVQPDLSEANLRGAQLGGAIMNKAASSILRDGEVRNLGPP